MCLGRIVGAGIGGGGQENPGIAGEGMQVVELGDRPALGIEAGVQVTHHDFLQHELEKIGLLVAGDERVHRAAKLLELGRRKPAQRRQGKIDERDSSVRRDALNCGPDTNRFLADSFGSSAA